jgi:hypothetical protein
VFVCEGGNASSPSCAGSPCSPRPRPAPTVTPALFPAQLLRFSPCCRPPWTCGPEATCSYLFLAAPDPSGIPRTSPGYYSITPLSPLVTAPCACPSLAPSLTLLPSSSNRPWSGRLFCARCGTRWDKVGVRVRAGAGRGRAGRRVVGRVARTSRWAPPPAPPTLRLGLGVCQWTGCLPWLTSSDVFYYIILYSINSPSPPRSACPTRCRQSSPAAGGWSPSPGGTPCPSRRRGRGTAAGAG